MRYELYYWPSIQGRGEFVRLTLEEAGAKYLDVARGDEKQGKGLPALMRFLESAQVARPPFAPPFLKAGKQIVGQTANILQFLGARHDLAPSDEAGRLWTHQLQLTIADLVDEVHEGHHPISSALYYEDQKREARKRTAELISRRLPKYLGYLERVLDRNRRKGPYLAGNALSYVDLSAFQIIAGLRYAFPRAMARLEIDCPRLIALHDLVSARPRIAAYLESERRVRFNRSGIFRHYPELDK
jgi:glutathione S-transferase